MQKQLLELDSTPKGSKRKEIVEVCLEDSNPSDSKKSRCETETRDQQQDTSVITQPSGNGEEMMVDHVAEAIDAVARGPPSPSPLTPLKSEVMLEPATNGTPVKSEKKPRRINLITLMKPKDKEQA